MLANVIEQTLDLSQSLKLHSSANYRTRPSWVEFVCCLFISYYLY